MRENGEKIELEGLSERIKGYIFAPACIKKLQFKAFLNWNALVGLWTFYTRLYAVHISSYKIIGNDLKIFSSNSTMRWLKRLVILGIFFWLIKEVRGRQRDSRTRGSDWERTIVKNGIFKISNIKIDGSSEIEVHQIFCLKVLIRPSK